MRFGLVACDVRASSWDPAGAGSISTRGTKTAVAESRSRAFSAMVAPSFAVARPKGCSVARAARSRPRPSQLHRLQPCARRPPSIAFTRQVSLAARRRAPTVRASSLILRVSYACQSNSRTPCMPVSATIAFSRMGPARIKRWSAHSFAPCAGRRKKGARQSVDTTGTGAAKASKALGLVNTMDWLGWMPRRAAGRPARYRTRYFFSFRGAS